MARLEYAGLVGHGKECGFYSKYKGELLACLRQISDLIFIFKRSLYLLHEVTRVEAGRLVS